MTVPLALVPADVRYPAAGVACIAARMYGSSPTHRGFIAQAAPSKEAPHGSAFDTSIGSANSREVMRHFKTIDISTKYYFSSIKVIIVMNY